MIPKPVWLFDVDGVLADFCAGVDHVAAGLGVDPVPEWLHWKMSEVYPTVTTELLAACRSKGFARRLPEIPGAVAAVRDVLNSGRVRVVFVTAPMTGSQTWPADRRAWLEERFECPEIISTDHKDLVRGDVFVDDSPEHVTKWWDAHPHAKAHLVRRPYNKAWHMSNFAVDSIEEAIRKALNP